MSLIIGPMIDFAHFSTILLSGFMKMPQIYNTFRSGSTMGISFYGLLMEFLGYSLMMSYNFYSGYSLASYLEYPLLFLQDLVLLVTLLHFMKGLSMSSLFPFSALVMLIVGIGWGYLPTSLVLILVNLCTPLSASSKILQLKTIFTSKDSTGVSVTSWLISAYTNFARLFTIYIESYDVSLLVNFFISLVLSLSIVVASIVYEPKRSDRVKKD